LGKGSGAASPGGGGARWEPPPLRTQLGPGLYPKRGHAYCKARAYNCRHDRVEDWSQGGPAKACLRLVFPLGSSWPNVHTPAFDPREGERGRESERERRQGAPILPLTRFLFLTPSLLAHAYTRLKRRAHVRMHRDIRRHVHTRMDGHVCASMRMRCRCDAPPHPTTRRASITLHVLPPPRPCGRLWLEVFGAAGYQSNVARIH
jgi:hypothetical protein